nr:hypothetical protein [Tanacetum cinerariifolium]
MAIDYAPGRRHRKLRPKEAWETIKDLAQHKEEEWNDLIFSEKGNPDYIDATLEQELESRRHRKLRPKEAWETIKDLAQHKEEEWNDLIFSEKGNPDYIDATLEQELESMECQVEGMKCY